MGTVTRICQRIRRTPSKFVTPRGVKPSGPIGQVSVDWREGFIPVGGGRVVVVVTRMEIKLFVRYDF